MSLRERPTLPVMAGAMKTQAYFHHLEFEIFIKSIASRFDVLHHLTNLEQQVIADAKSGWNEPLGDRLRAEIRVLATGGSSRELPR